MIHEISLSFPTEGFSYIWEMGNLDTTRNVNGQSTFPASLKINMGTTNLSTCHGPKK